MSITAVEHIYRYGTPSRADNRPGGVDLRLATSGREGPGPVYFRGRLARPVRAADLLRGVVEIVRSRFYVPPSVVSRILAQADPVVTCGDEVIRFEGFSACCGAYARADFLPPAFDGDRIERGTTNVDFGAPMRAALARVRDGDDVGLAIGVGSVELARGGETVEERKVPLPLRWLAGFVEVQAYQARMSPRMVLPAALAARFLRSLPRGSGTGTAWIVPAGRGVRLSQMKAPGAVRVGGVGRLRVLEPIVRHARSLRIHADDPSGATAWELVMDEARFHLVLSPEVARGFSGEGQVLDALVRSRWLDALPKLRAALRWESRIDPDAIAERAGLDRVDVLGALAGLGSRGLVGFDLAEGAYFHRELPFDLQQVEALHPRLRSARKLAEGGGVRFTRRERAEVEAFVKGTRAEHRVRILGKEATCTCPWQARHLGERGPCKHVLAVRIELGEEVIE